MPNNNSYLNSEEIQEIIGQIPPWIVRWGISVLCFVFIVSIFCSYFIEFPDVLPAKVVISSKSQPFRISWYKNGPHFHKVYVKEGDCVREGDTLLVEESMIDSSITPITSAVEGKVILFKGTEDNPRKSTIIVYPEILEYETELYLSSKGLGKVRPDQRVLIKLDAYPNEDFGILEGKITSILPVSLGGKYRATVGLKSGLVTTENKAIPAQHLLEGGAEILLEQRNLFQRIFGSVF